MKMGVGGKVGPVRGGISNRGIGVGAGPVSTGVSHKESGSCLSVVIGAALLAALLMLLIVLVPLALALLAAYFLAQKRLNLAAATLVLALLSQWGCWHFIERNYWDRHTNGVVVGDLSWKTEEEVRHITQQKGIRHVKFTYPADREDGKCFVHDQTPSPWDKVSPRYDTLKIEMLC